MRKKDFITLIEKHKSLFQCLSIDDATIRRGYNHFAIVIVWKTSTVRTVVQTARGRYDSLKANELLGKYLKWLN